MSQPPQLLLPSRPISRGNSIACSSITSFDMSQRSSSPDAKSSDSRSSSPVAESLRYSSSPQEDESSDFSSHPIRSSAAIEISSIDSCSSLKFPGNESSDSLLYAVLPDTTPLDISSISVLGSSSNPSPSIVDTLDHCSNSTFLVDQTPDLPSPLNPDSPVAFPQEYDPGLEILFGESSAESSLVSCIPSRIVEPLGDPSCSLGASSEFLPASRIPSPVMEPLNDPSCSLEESSPEYPPVSRIPSPVMEPLNDPSCSLGESSPEYPPVSRIPSPVMEPLGDPSSSLGESSPEYPPVSRIPSPVMEPLGDSAISLEDKSSLLTLSTSLPSQPFDQASSLSSGPPSGSSSVSDSQSPSTSPNQLSVSLDIGLVKPLSRDCSPPAQNLTLPKTSVDTGEERPFREKSSPAKEEWKLQKLEGSAGENSDRVNDDADERDSLSDSSDNSDSVNDVVDELMQLTGLEEVKQQVLAIKAKVDICNYQGTSLKKERFNAVFQGNPGTGKTTVARLYANFLKAAKILQSGALNQFTGAGLASLGAVGANMLIQKILGDGGGVLFVDEAYQLTAPHASDSGRQVLDLLLTEMENNIGKLAVIFVGYNYEMESFFEHNPGLASRIPYTLQFADFRDVELWGIMRDLISEKYGYDDDNEVKMKMQGGIDGLYMRIAIRRLARGRGTRGFGNARAVHNLLSVISDRQARRLLKLRREERRLPTKAEYFYFTKEDLIGQDPSLALFKSVAWKKLQTLIGLEKVKRSAKNMIDMIQTNYRRELLEKSPLDFCLNRVLYGSPGTGKTTVAKLYGQILADLGLLSKGEVVIKNPSDFIGQCLGKSEAKTRAILATTVGKVLIIDEAYMLSTGESGDKQDSYKAAVIDTLVAEVQGVPGDDRCVLLLGYEDKLKEMFRNVNPGLSRRFSIDDPFHFQDFNMSQLRLVLDQKMKAQDIRATKDAEDVAADVLDRARMRPNFSNGGEVDNLLDRAKLNYQERQSNMDLEERNVDVIFLPEDFDPEFDREGNAIANTQAMLDGCVDKEIIVKLVGYQRRAVIAKESGMDPRNLVPTNFVFKGPPGTGKSTTARLMGKLYYNMGFLSTEEVIECSASDLIGQYMGHTGPKTKSQFDKALGKVLFIDEAYRLTDGQYATEAVNELKNLMSTPKYAGRMIVILAGYTQDMDELMKARRALSTLFPEEIVFKNIHPDDCMNLLHRELKKLKISAPFLEDQAGNDYRDLRNLVQALSVFPSWGNARDIKTLAQDMSASVFNQIVMIRNSGIPKSKAPEITSIETGVTETIPPEASTSGTTATESLIPESTSGIPVAALNTPEKAFSKPEVDLSPEQAFECIKRVFIMHYQRAGNQKKTLPPVDSSQTATQPTKSAEDTATDCGGFETSADACDPLTTAASQLPKTIAMPPLNQTKVRSNQGRPPSLSQLNSDADAIRRHSVSSRESEHLQSTEESREQHDEHTPKVRKSALVPKDIATPSSNQILPSPLGLPDSATGAIRRRSVSRRESDHLQSAEESGERQDEQASNPQKISLVKTVLRHRGKLINDMRKAPAILGFRRRKMQESSERGPKIKVQEQQRKLGKCGGNCEWVKNGDGWQCSAGVCSTEDPYVVE